jgi:PAS domain S-box-containing protein
MHRLLARQVKKCIGNVEGVPEDVLRLLEAVDAAYVQNDEDRELLERSMDISSQELLQRNTALAAAERKYRYIFEHSTQGIFQVSLDWRTVISANQSVAETLGYPTPEALCAVPDIAAEAGTDMSRLEEAATAMGADGLISNWEFLARRRDGAAIWLSVSMRPYLDPVTGAITHYDGTMHEITARKQAEADREELQGRLLTASRQAGMAEVATGVLHNVGNVLNSINVSATLAADRLRQLHLQSIERAASLLQQQASTDLAAFLTGPGRQLPEYLQRLHRQLRDEQQAILEELRSLADNVEHVKCVISLQQAYGRISGVNQTVCVQELVEDAIHLHLESLQRHRVEVVREFAPVPHASLDKHRVFQILVNLLGNAHQAMRDVTRPRRLTVRMAVSTADPSRFAVQVSDTGVGIAPENVIRIFSHGYTTKPDGHGFGLHTSALAATAMGGSLSVQSDGPDTGATFTLELPVLPLAAPRAPTERVTTMTA